MTATALTNTITVDEAPSQGVEWSTSSLTAPVRPMRRVGPPRLEEPNPANTFEVFVVTSHAKQPLNIPVFANAINLSEILHPPAPTTLDVTRGKLHSLVQQLIRLKLDAESEGLIPPTDYAYTRTKQLVTDAYALLWLQEFSKYSNLLTPNISTDDLGGVRISWRQSGRVLRANIGARNELRSYLYSEEGQFHGIERLEKEELVEKLKWLVR